MNPQLAVVIPIFNEAATLPELFRRLTVALAAVDLSYEIVFVDDGSRDESPRLLADFAKADERVRVITLSRNFGHQPALSAGLDFAKGAAVIMMDGDLQDPPELLPELIRVWLDGAEVVMTVKSRRDESWPLRLAFDGFYRVLGALSRTEIPAGAGIFCLMDRRVVDVLVSLPERSRYLVGLREWLGFRRAVVHYERPRRHAGRSRVGLLGLTRLAFDAIFSFSVIPLRLITMLGFVMASASFLGGAFIVALRLFTDRVDVPGWASFVAVATTVPGGRQ